MSRPVHGRVLLVFPPAHFRLGSGHLPDAGTELPYTFPPLGLLYLAAVLRRADWAAEVVDFGGEPYSVGRLLAAARDADVVGLSVVRDNRHQVRRVIEDLHRGGSRAPIIVGGPDVTLRPVLFDHCVATVCGEAEQIIVELVERLLRGDGICGLPGVLSRDPRDGQPRQASPPVLPADLDAIPLPDRSLCDRMRYSMFDERNRGRTALVITSRGCPFDCSFCSRVALTQHGYRVRSPDNVLDELALLHRDGYRFLFFGDNNFMLDRGRVCSIMDGIVARGLNDLRIVVAGRADAADAEIYRRMRRAGVFLISLGLESGNQDSLAFLNKRTSVERNRQAVRLADRAGLFVHGNFIIGSGNETLQHVERTRRFALELPLDSIFVNILAYQYGSPLWQRAHQEGRIADGELNKLSTADNGLGQLSEAELRRELKRMLRTFFLRGSYWARQAVKAVRLREPYFLVLVGKLCARYFLTEMRRAWRPGPRGAA